MSYLVLFCSCVFSILLALRLPRLGKRELILVLFVRLFDLRLFGFVCFLFLLVSGKGCGLWLWHSLDFSLTFYFCYYLLLISTVLCFGMWHSLGILTYFLFIRKADALAVWPVSKTPSLILWTYSAGDKLMIFFSQKIGLNFSCKLSPVEIICMKFWGLFSEEKSSFQILSVKKFTHDAKGYRHKIKFPSGFPY